MRHAGVWECKLVVKTVRTRGIELEVSIIALCVETEEIDNY